MAMVGMIYGDIMRKTALLSEINWDWWDTLSPSLHLYYAPLAATALKKYVRKLRRRLENESQTPIPTTVKGPIIWVIDLCCGFQSRKKACMQEMREHAGCGTCRYIGLDIAPVLIVLLEIMPEPATSAASKHRKATSSHRIGQGSSSYAGSVPSTGGSCTQQ